MKFFHGTLFFLVAFILQLKFGRLGFGLHHILLLSLIVLATVLRTRELLFFVAASAWFLNWQPTWSGELVGIFVIPFAVHFLKEIFPGSAFLGCVLAGGLGVGMWYVFADIRFVSELPLRFMGEVVLGVLWGMLLFGTVQGLRATE